MSCATLCTFLQPVVNCIQLVMNVMYLPLNLVGIVTPPVASWFQPLVSCTLT